MTDTVDDIVVTGQRRRPGGSFPIISKGNPSGDNPDEYPENPDGGTPDPYFNPCEDPVQRLEWDADAAASQALAAFKAKAFELQDDGLYEREFGAGIYQRPDGTMFIGPVTYGDKMGSAVNIDHSLGTYANMIGEIHSHPGGQIVPSGNDWQRVDSFSSYTGRNFRSYVVARDTTVANSPFAIRVYDTNSDRDFTKPGPEVNPEGQSCAL